MTSLSQYGYDRWLDGHVGELCGPEHRIARVIIVDRGRYVVGGERGNVAAELTGRFQFTAEATTDLPCVGDWVCVSYHGDDQFATVHAVLARKTVLRRKAAGKHVDYQLIAANVDIAFIVQSCHYDFNLRRLERYLVMVNDGRIEPVIVLTKTDLVGQEELNALISTVRNAGILARIIPISNVTSAGIDELKAVMGSARTHCLLGSSGVGKTTLINSLLDRPALKTNTVSLTGEGRHTTVRRQLIMLLNGSMLIDTPGMRELGLIAGGEGIDDSFSDLVSLAQNCRFSDCTHTSEPGCAILSALEQGEINPEHHRNYLKLKKESDFHEMSYVEKRKKDKQFGKFIRTALRTKRKKQ
jgi:ribosome biogenesis GTPase